MSNPTFRPHQFKVGDVVQSKSGATYRITGLRSDDHPKLKGDLGYDTQGIKDGKDVGPMRLIRASSLFPITK